MKTFRDAIGREWQITLNIYTLTRIRDGVGLNLARPGQDLAGVIGDDLTFAAILWEMVRDQAKQLGLLQEQFLASLTGEVLEQAKSLFVEELVSFFPKLRPVMETMRQIEETYSQALVAEMERLKAEAQDPEKIREQIRRQIEQEMKAG
ncbi:MAG TPA: hypothetical protein PKI05_02290 [Thermogutta sp.]|nr:hypothetical protein [Thermogutta sp.]